MQISLQKMRGIVVRLEVDAVNKPWSDGLRLTNKQSPGLTNNYGSQTNKKNYHVNSRHILRF